jgi:hypothetical protein
VGGPSAGTRPAGRNEAPQSPGEYVVFALPTKDGKTY